MARKRWYAFSGLVQRQLSSSTEITQLGFELFWTTESLGFYPTLEDAQAALEADDAAHRNRIAAQYRIVQQSSVQTFFAPQSGIVIVPLTPLPVFTRPGKILTTRGFWDVASVTNPQGNVSNFAFGMTMLPVSKVFAVTIGDDGVEQYVYRGSNRLPDPLLDDIGWFCYDSFVRVTTDVNQDPPFHSKTTKKFPAHSALACIASVEVDVAQLTSLRLNFGIRFRMLVEH